MAVTKMLVAIIAFSRKLVLFGLILSMFIAGCGVYTLSPRGKSTISTITIEPLENQTSEFGLADRLTQILVDAFIEDGSLKVVPVDQTEAQLVGTLLSYRRLPNTFDASDQVQSYKVRMEFKLTLKNVADGTEFWSQKVSQEGVYEADTETEEDGQLRATALLVETVLDLTTKSW